VEGQKKNAVAEKVVETDKGQIEGSVSIEQN
jgi:hypothetical protein